MNRVIPPLNIKKEKKTGKKRKKKDGVFARKILIGGGGVFRDNFVGLKTKLLGQFEEIYVSNHPHPIQNEVRGV